MSFLSLSIQRKTAKEKLIQHARWNILHIYVHLEKSPLTMSKKGRALPKRGS